MAKPREKRAVSQAGVGAGLLALRTLVTAWNPVLTWFTWVASAGIINALFPDKMLKQEKQSPSYDWRYKANDTASHELSMPIVYGKARIKPVVKNRFISMDGDKQYLNILYSFTGHRIDRRDIARVIPNAGYMLNDEVRSLGGVFDEPERTFIAIKDNALGVNYARIGTPTDTGEWRVGPGTAAITDILVNGIRLDSMITGNSEDIKYETRPGIAEQTIIEGFEVTYSNIPQALRVDNDSFVFTTIQTTSLVTQNIEVTVYFPNGQYVTQPNGTLLETLTNIIVQYREIGTERWFDFEYGIHNAVVDTLKSGIVTAAHPSRITHFIGIESKTVTPFSRVFKAKLGVGNYLTTGKLYETRIAATPTISELQLINVATISYAEPDADDKLRGLTYPGEALLGMKIPASGQFSGDIEVTAIVERSTVKVYNTIANAWVDGDANKHAWAVYDMLANGHSDHPEYPNVTNSSTVIQPVYGAGLAANRIDYASFKTWSEYVGDGKPNLDYELNIVFDSPTTIWDAVMRICQEGRGITYPIGSKFFALIDRKVASSDISQLFSMGNMDIGSFSQGWIDKSKKANTLEITYNDEDRNYDQVRFALRTSDWDTTSDLNEPTALALNGTTNYDQAVALGTYLLNCNELLNHICNCTMDLDALQSQVGDVVRVQHDTMVGSGGRIVSYDSINNAITLDKDITFVTGVTYDFYIQLSDGTIGHDTISKTDQTTNILAFSGSGDWSTDPTQYDSWAFGAAGSATKLFRIIDISMDGQYKRQISLLEYNVNVYKADLNNADSQAKTDEKVAGGNFAGSADLGVWNVQKIAPDLSLPTLSNFNTAGGVTLSEIITRDATTGDYISSIVVSWTPEDGGNWGQWDVLWREPTESKVWQGIWDNATSYDEDESVVYDGYAYRSTTDSNQGSKPFRRVV